MPKKRRRKDLWEVALEKVVKEREALPARSTGRPILPMVLHITSHLLFTAAREEAGPDATPKQIATIIVGYYPPEMQTEAMVENVKRWLRDQSRGVCPGVGPHLLEAVERKLIKELQG